MRTVCSQSQQLGEVDSRPSVPTRKDESDEKDYLWALLTSIAGRRTDFVFGGDQRELKSNYERHRHDARQGNRLHDYSGMVSLEGKVKDMSPSKR